MKKKPWLVICKSGREFIVYALCVKDANMFFRGMMPLEQVELVYPSTDINCKYAYIDDRKAPGA